MASLLLLPLAVRPAAAQTGLDPCPVRLAPAADSAARPPDVVLSASAQIRELRFQSQPQASIRLSGCPSLDSIRVQRRNLPSPVEPGVTYRDVMVGVEAVGHLDVQCLVAPAGAITDSLRALLGRSLAGLCSSPPADSSAAGRPRR